MQWQLTNNATLKQHRIATLIFFFVSGFGYSTWASRIPTIQQQMHLDDAQLGGVLLASPVGVLITVPFTSSLLSRFSSKSIMLIGAVFYNVLLALLGFITQTWQLVIILFLFGSSRNLLNLSINTQGVEVQSLYEKSIITTFHGMWSMAGFAGAALGYLFINLKLSLLSHVLSVSVFLIVISFLFFSNTYYKKPVQQQRKPVFSLPDKYMLKFSLIAFASMACENTMYDWSGIYFQKVVHASEGIATAGFVLYMIAMTTGRFLGDKLVDKLGVKTILKSSGVLIFAGLLFAVLLPYPFTAGLGFIFTGLGVSCIIPLVFSMAGKSKTMNSSTAIAAVSTIGYFGFLAVPPGVGFIAKAVGLQWSFGIVSLMGLLILLMVRKINAPVTAAG